VTSTPNVEIATPILLFNDECSVCRHVAKWVAKFAVTASGEPTVVEQPIGDDPERLRSLNEGLDIWDAYETIHLLMPDGSMKVGGEACGEVFRRMPRTQWLARSLSIDVWGFRPLQELLNVGYVVLSDVRPAFGCESCGTPPAWLAPIVWTKKQLRAISGDASRVSKSLHFSRTKPH
jgi:predicted DCC family thiol-disulfide oxidoreductase YuxK